MTRRAPDPRVVRWALAALEAGESLAEVAREAGVSATTVRRWRDSPAAPEVLVAEPEPAAELDLHALEALPADASSFETVRAMIASTRADYERARRSNNATLTKQYSSNLARILPVLARLERAAQESGDVVRIERGEVARIRARLHADLATILARGELRCAECSRRLSVRLATEGNEE